MPHFRTLFFYIARRFVLHIAAVLAACFAIIFFANLAELLRRLAGKDPVPFSRTAEMALLQTPGVIEAVLPFAFLLGGLFCFLALTRSRELIVARTSGLPARLFLIPALLIAFLSGVIATGVLNPVSAQFSARFEALEARHLKGRTSLLAFSDTGLWLRQPGAQAPSVIHALRAADQGRELYDVTFFVYEPGDLLTGRLDAERAVLEEGYWDLRNVWISSPDALGRFAAAHRHPTTLTLRRVRQSFALPVTISFWELPRFIELARAAGFSAAAHRLHFYELAARPFFLCAMTLLGAAFALFYADRRGRMVALVCLGTASGFVIYGFLSLTRMLSLSGIVPAALTVAGPILLTGALGLALLLYQEE